MRRFIFLYLLYLAIAFLLIDYTPMREALGIESRYNAFIANLTAPLVEAAGIGARADGEILRLPHANMIIKFGCNGLEAVLIYLAGVLAYPAPWRSRLFWGGVGVILLELINLARITLLAWVIERYPRQFDLMHDYITQSIMIVLAFLLFLLYLQRIEGAKR